MDSALTSTYDFFLPQNQVAQMQVNPRDSSKLLICSSLGRLGCFKESFVLTDDVFKNIGLNENDFVVLNDAKVLPVRLLGRRKTGGAVECMVLGMHGVENIEYKVMLRFSGKVRKGLKLFFEPDLDVEILSTPEERLAEGGEVSVHFYGGKNIMNREALEKWLELYGHVPLPPYIRREAVDTVDTTVAARHAAQITTARHASQITEDRSAYQTVYAEKTGSAAAPTAGFHFTRTLIEALEKRGVQFGKITLHVGIGTFRPIKTETLSEHKMHEEKYEISENFRSRFLEAKKSGRRIVAVGTTVVRALESWMQPGGGFEGKFVTSAFIRPGFKFNAVDDLVTNFHLPKSTLLVLISAALGSVSEMKRVYRHAVDKRYRFFSYGDAMFIRGR